MNLVSPQKLILASILGCLIAFSSCSVIKNREIAEQAVAYFHRQFNARQYREIYYQAHEDFRNMVSEADVVNLFQLVSTKLGKVEHADQITWNVTAAPVGTTVTLQYATIFTEGTGTEQFSFLIKDGKATLYGYHINSPLLLTQ